jgi:hypothetical protein
MEDRTIVRNAALSGSVSGGRLGPAKRPYTRTTSETETADYSERSEYPRVTGMQYLPLRGTFVPCVDRPNLGISGAFTLITTTSAVKPGT